MTKSHEKTAVEKLKNALLADDYVLAQSIIPSVSPLSLFSLFQSFCNDRKTKPIECLLPFVDPLGREGSALVTAAVSNNPDVLRLLLNATNDAPSTQLDAVKKEYLKKRNEIIQKAYLYSIKAAPSHCYDILVDRVEWSNSFYQDAAREAISHGKTEILEFLLNQMEKWDREDLAYEMLSFSAWCGGVVCLKCLIKNTYQMPYGDQILFSAVSENHTDAAIVLLSHSDPKQNDSRSLCMAIKNENNLLVDILLPLSNTRHALSYMKQNPITFAPEHQNALLKFLAPQKEKEFLHENIQKKILTPTPRKI